MTTITELRVFVASPGDTKAERDVVQKIIEQVNSMVGNFRQIRLKPVMWETDAWPGFGEDAQDLINQQIKGYDIFVGIMWNRFGTPTNRAPSGTYEEFNRAYDLWKTHKVPTLMFYFNRQPIDTDDSNLLMQKIEVLRFKEHMRNAGGLYWEYNGIDEFKELLTNHLLKEAAKWQPVGEQEHIQQEKRVQQEMREVFNEPQTWNKLLKRGQWQLTEDRKIISGGVNSYLLSSFDYGDRTFAINCNISFFKYSKYAMMEPDTANAGIILAWKPTGHGRSYVNLLFTGEKIILEEIGGSGADPYFDFQHLSPGILFKVEDGRKYRISAVVSPRSLTIHIDDQMVYSNFGIRNVFGRVGLRPWRSRIECEYFEVYE